MACAAITPQSASCGTHFSTAAPSAPGITYDRRNSAIPGITMLQRLLPVLYALEFLLTLIAVYTVWGEVGGQNHLDYMPWYWKAGIGFGTAFAVIPLTTAIASDHPSSRRRTIAWTLVLFSLGLSAGLVTFYYHLNEPPDDEDTPVTVTPTARLSRPPSDSSLTRC